MSRVKITVLVSGVVLLFASGGLYFYAHLEEYVLPRFVPPASVWVNEHKPLGEQTARVELGGRVFNIPLMYIESKRPIGGVFKDSILLEVIWPDLRSIYELKNRAEYDRVAKGERKRGWILLQSASARPSLDAQVANNRRSFAKEEFLDKTGNVEHFLWYRGTQSAPELWEEAFLERNATGNIVTRITCRRGAILRYAMCNHAFMDDGIFYSLSYNQENFLDHWREQQGRVVEFLRKMETNTATFKEGK